LRSEKQETSFCRYGTARYPLAQAVAIALAEAKKIIPYSEGPQFDAVQFLEV
jgi:hypothetical protein